MPFLIALLLILGIVFLPQWWTRHLFRRHGKERSDIPGTGAELARHLIERFKLEGVEVESTEGGDHFDPQSRRVRLSSLVHDGRSLTAVAVAAHEVGHAIQHHRGEALLATRTRLVGLAQLAQRGGAALMFAIPVITLLTRVPQSGLLLFLLGLASLGSAVLVHLVTLPVEWDASFNKALPILKEGEYISPRDEAAVRSLLRAAALTYVAASLASLLNLARWIALLRR